MLLLLLLTAREDRVRDVCAGAGAVHYRNLTSLKINT